MLITDLSAYQPFNRSLIILCLYLDAIYIYAIYLDGFPAKEFSPNSNICGQS